MVFIPQRSPMLSLWEYLNMMGWNSKFTIWTSWVTILWFLTECVARTCIRHSFCHYHILSPAMGLRAVSAVYALRQSSITESCQPMPFVPQNNPSLLILVWGIHQKIQWFLNKVNHAWLLGKTASYKVHKLIVTWTNSYIQIYLFQIS
jgi:hypothetical protein